MGRAVTSLLFVLMVLFSHVVLADEQARELPPEVSKNNAKGATSAANNAASQPGSAGANSVVNGADAAARANVNSSTANALAQSAYVDQLYEDKKINREDWLALKTGMAASMMGAFQQGTKGAPPIRSMNDSQSNSKQSPGSQPSIGPSTPNNVETLPAATPLSIPSMRSPASLPVPQAAVENDPHEVGAGAQILELNQGTVYATTIVPDTAPIASAESKDLKAPADPKRLEMDESAKPNGVQASAVGFGLGGGRSESDKNNVVAKEDKAVLLAQKLLNEHQAKMAAKAAAAGKAISAEDDPESFRQAHARALLSLQGLKKVKRVQDSDEERAPIEFSPEQIVNAVAGDSARNPAGDVINNPWGKQDLIFEDGAMSNWALFFIAMLGLFAGLAVAYPLFMRPQKALVQLMVPGSGEHFTIRPGTKDGSFILDIMDVRGKLVRTAGMLRPDSVARAAVLPPDLAARLGAKGSFDRFEFTRDGQFVRTEKDEGYQVFPFVIEE